MRNCKECATGYLGIVPAQRRPTYLLSHVQLHCALNVDHWPVHGFLGLRALLEEGAKEVLRIPSAMGKQILELSADRTVCQSRNQPGMHMWTPIKT